MEYCGSGFGLGGKWEDFEMRAREANYHKMIIKGISDERTQKEKRRFTKKASIFIKHLNNHG